MARLNRSAIFALILSGVIGLFPLIATFAAPRVIKVIADRDNKFKVPGQKQPIITVKAGEVVQLEITSRKGTEWDKDGAVHSFTITALKDRGWDIRLKEGKQTHTLVAPDEPGEYVVECLVSCGKGHNEMRMKLVVTP